MEWLVEASLSLEHVSTHAGSPEKILDYENRDFLVGGNDQRPLHAGEQADFCHRHREFLQAGLENPAR